MVSFYNIFDLILVVLICYFSFYAYKSKTYLKIFHYFKIFLLITISAKLALYTGIILQDIYIIKADTYTTLLLIGFGINIIILLHTYKYIYNFLNKIINSNKIKKFAAIVISCLEVTILSTFALYLTMQLYISKQYLSNHLDKTYSYKIVEKFYHKFLNDNFVNMVMGSDTGTNTKEVIFKSFKNAF